MNFWGQGTATQYRFVQYLSQTETYFWLGVECSFLIEMLNNDDYTFCKCKYLYMQI